MSNRILRYIVELLVNNIYKIIWDTLAFYFFIIPEKRKESI